jgi:Tol biopolymer transport system component
VLAIPYWVEPQEGKIVDLCKDVTPTQICIHDVKTGQITRVTSDLDFGQVGGLGWSPDGQQILFSAGPNPEITGWWDDKLYLLHVKEPLQGIDRSDLRQITSGDTTDLDPAWSPDGQWIAFQRNCGLWVIRPDGAGARMLLVGTEDFCANWPAWSPDSQQIAFSNVGAPFIEVWVIDADGSDPRLIYTFERRLEWGFPAWSHDGRQIACRYSDDREAKTLLIRVDGSGEPQIVGQTPWWWSGNFWPQWGG